jgi:hypothetical protein
VGKPEEKRPFGIYIRRWEDNIKTVLKEIGWENVNWINLAQDMYKWFTPVNMVMNIEFHKMR